MFIKVAGEKKEYPEGLTVKELIEKEDVETPQYVTVTINYRKWCFRIYRS